MEVAETAPTDSYKKVSSNDVDYASFVLYTKQGNAACEYLRTLAAKSHDVIIQEVEQIQGPRPQWLRGVPTLVRLSDYQLFTGTHGIEELKRHLSTGVQGIGSDSLSGSAVSRAALLEDFTVEEPATSSARGFDLRIGEDKYVDAPRERNAGGMDLESMLRMRAQRASGGAMH